MTCIDIYQTRHPESSLISRQIFRIQRFLKSKFEIILTLFAMPLLLPLGIVIAALIKLDSKGPIFFSQDQLGLNGTIIRPLKFRTMQMGAEAALQRLIADGGPLSEEYTAFHKLRQDPRVTRLGSFLRRTSLDELPQFLNVLMGDMDLVGPRPYLVREVPDMEDLEQVILLVKPGITGYWQVNARSSSTFHRRLEMDIEYIENLSFLKDLQLLFKTFAVVLNRKDAC